MSVDPATIAFYDGHAAEYAEFASETGEHPRLQRFLDALPEDAKVLDFGCGIGWAAAAMAEAGHRVDAMDASTGLIAEAKRRYGLTVRRAHFRTLSARARYDGIWCHFALQHAPRADRPQIFERLRTALKSGGLLYIGAQKGPLDWRDDHGRLYCPFREEEMRDLLAAAGFGEPEITFGTGKNFDGTPSLGLYVWVRADG